MWYLRYILFFFAAHACSVVFFNSSISATIIGSCVLNFLASGRFELKKENKKRINRYILLAGVLVSVLLIMIGKFYIYNDMLIIVGAAIFSIFIVTGLNSLFRKYIQNKK